MSDETQRTAELDLEAARRRIAELEADLDRCRLASRILDRLPYGVCYVDAGRRVRYVNATCAASAGVTPGDLVGHPLDSGLPARCSSPALEEIDQVMAGGAPRTVEAHGPGGEEWFAISCVADRDAAGEVRGCMIVSQDVTQRRQAERALAESEERYRALFEQATVGIVLFDPQSETIVEFNDQAHQGLGYTREEFGRLKVHDFDTLDGPAEVTARARAVAGAGRLTFETRHLTKGGELRSVRVTAKMVPLRGRPLLMGVFEDLTDLRRAEEDLRLQAEVMRNMAEGVYLIRADDLRIVYANPKFEEMFGYEPGELIGLEVSVVNAPSDDLSPSEVRDAISAVIRETGTWSGEVANVKKDGSPLWCAASVSTFDHPRFGPVLVSVHSDITEQKRAEDERRRLQAQLLHAQKLESLGVLAGGIAHDFNNLLGGLVMNTDLVRRYLPPDSRGHAALERMALATRQASALTGQMLAYAGKGDLAFERIDLGALVGEFVDLLRTSVSKKARLVLDLAEGLPAVEADPTQLRQIVMNLVINASEALGDAEGTISIRTALGRVGGGDGVLLEVSDTGCGMSEETRARVFDPFFTTKFTGRGLGLAAVLGIVRSHEGEVEVESAPEEGTTFRILLPGCDGAAAPDADRCADGEWRGAGTLLLLDDERVMLESAADALETLGFTVLTAANGADAVALFRERGAEVAGVLLDYLMPQMDGAEALVELRKIRADVPVILCSGYSEREALERFGHVGLAGFLQKPFGIAALEEKLSAVLA